MIHNLYFEKKKGTTILNCAKKKETNARHEDIDHAMWKEYIKEYLIVITDLFGQ